MRKTLAALTVAAAFTLAPTPAHAATYDCTYVWTTNGGHTAKARCDDGPKNQYRIIVEFCGPSGCFSATSPWTNYGNTASVTSSYAYAQTGGYGLNAR